MPLELWNFIILFVGIIIVFVFLNRPLYEATALVFILLLTVNGKWGNAWEYILSGAKSSILFTIVTFLLFSSILKKTGVIEDCIDIILALVGRIPGGVGLVSIISSAFMGAISGSGPGNIAATGSVTIPLMKRAGYSSELSAGIAMAGSCLGPIIPPSATIVASFACLSVLPGYENYTFSSFWMVMYGISIVFIMQRIIQMYIMTRAYGVKPVPIDELPKLKEAWAKGWKSFILIFVILLPFVIDNAMGDFLTKALGEEARANFSSSVLIFTPAIATVYSLIIGKEKFKVSISSLASAMSEDLKSIVSLSAILFTSYAISALLTDCNTVAAIEALLLSMNVSYIGMLALLIVAATLLGMFISGTAMIALVGPIYITILSAYGMNPILVAAMFPVLFVSLGQMTPPFAVCMYAAIGIAQADFKKTCIQAGIWSIVQIILVFLIMNGIIPVLWL